MEEAKECLNCGKMVKDNFCSHCGQAKTAGRIRLKEIFGHYLNLAFSFENTLFSTVKRLWLNPGKVCRDYLSGKRRTYLNPFAFILIVTVVYMAVRSLIQYSPLNYMDKDSVDFLQSGKIPYLSQSVLFVVHHLNNFLLLHAFVLALFLKLFWGKSFYFAELLFVSFYVLGLYIGLDILIMIMHRYTGWNVTPLKMFTMLMVQVYAFSSFYQRPTFGFGIRVLLVGFISFLSYALLALAATVLGYLLLNS